MTDTVDITIVKGASFRASFFVKDAVGNPVVLTGYSAKMQIKSSAGVLLLDISTDNSITITPNDGGVHIHLADEVTKDIQWYLAKYDVFIVAPNQPSGDAYKIVKGSVSIETSVTQLTT